MAIAINTQVSIIMKLRLPINDRSEWIAAITVSRISGGISMIGSGLILTMIFADRINKLKKTQYRLLVGICCSDMLFSFCTIISTAAIPKDTDSYYKIHGNVGNAATCKAQGFFIQLGILGMPLYLISLSLYYLLVIRYNVNDDVIRRKVEPFMHVFSICIPLSTAIAALCLNLYHQKLFVCWIEAKPWGCTVDKSLVCTEGANAPWYELSFAGIWFILAFVFEVICMGLIYATVRKRERIMNTFSFRGRDGRILSRCSTRVTEERRDTAIQAILYISAFLFTYLWPFGSFIMYHALGRSPDASYTLASIFFMSLLGFWNFIAFLRPRYVKVSRQNKDKSFVWKMKTILLSKDQRPTVISRNFARRRSSAASNISTTSNISTNSTTMFISSLLRFRQMKPNHSTMEQCPESHASCYPIEGDHSIVDIQNLYMESINDDN